MMIKVKSPLGVKKAVRLIDEMLAARNGEKRNIPQRDYAAMYPYETTVFVGCSKYFSVTVFFMYIGKKRN